MRALFHKFDLYIPVSQPFFGGCSKADLFGFKVSSPALVDLKTTLVKVAEQGCVERTVTEDMTVSSDPQPLLVLAIKTVPKATEDSMDTLHQNVYHTPTCGPVLLSTTLSNKTVAIPNPNAVREVHCNHLWEFRLYL